MKYPAKMLILLLITVLCALVIDPTEAIVIPIIEQDSGVSSPYQMNLSFNNLEWNSNTQKLTLKDRLMMIRRSFFLNSFFMNSKPPLTGSFP